MGCYKTYHAGPLMAVRYPEGEERRTSGLMGVPPKFFVAYFDEEWGEAKFDPITFNAARALRPLDVEKLGELMAADRKLEAE